jgi:hypothetical protein
LRFTLLFPTPKLHIELGARLWKSASDKTSRDSKESKCQKNRTETPTGPGRGQRDLETATTTVIADSSPAFTSLSRTPTKVVMHQITSGLSSTECPAFVYIMKLSTVIAVKAGMGRITLGLFSTECPAFISRGSITLKAIIMVGLFFTECPAFVSEGSTIVQTHITVRTARLNTERLLQRNCSDAQALS